MAINSNVQKNQLEAKLKEAEAEVTKTMADRNAKIVKNQLMQLNSIDGNYLEIEKQFLPCPKDPPMAKKDKGGNLVTAPPPP